MEIKNLNPKYSSAQLGLPGGERVYKLFAGILGNKPRVHFLLINVSLALPVVYLMLQIFLSVLYLFKPW